eukprot:965989-Pleurochrysis_carterae.AAC.2
MAQRESGTLRREPTAARAEATRVPTAAAAVHAPQVPAPTLVAPVAAGSAAAQTVLRCVRRAAVDARRSWRACALRSRGSHGVSHPWLRSALRKASIGVRGRFRRRGAARRGWSSSKGVYAVEGRNDDTATGTPECFARRSTSSSTAMQLAGTSSCSGRTCSCAQRSWKRLQSLRDTASAMALHSPETWATSANEATCA